jgi:hypothetical protein
MSRTVSAVDLRLTEEELAEIEGRNICEPRSGSYKPWICNRPAFSWSGRYLKRGSDRQFISRSSKSRDRAFAGRTDEAIVRT